MNLFRCQFCQNPLHFDNTLCTGCGRRVGYIQEEFEMAALEPDGPAWRALARPGQSYALCANVEYGVCNWLMDASDGRTICKSCRHNHIIPDLSVPGNRERWRKIELAKRYVFRSLMRWRLPIPDRLDDPLHGLVFDFKGDESKADGTVEKVLTGHDEGVVALNISEADDAEREARRTSMGEPYRTLIGHFRHEIGHFYWDRLIRDTGAFEGFRDVFGDERQDYAEALNRHYVCGPPVGWRESFISGYATSHPWEDFAETWAHCLHIVDSLETAHSYGIDIKPGVLLEAGDKPFGISPYCAKSISDLVRAWVPLTVAISGVNRSMGQPDLYPFVLSNPVIEKLGFIHALIRNNAEPMGSARAPIFREGFHTADV